MIPASSVDTQGRRAEWTSELGEGDVEAECKVGAGCESLSCFSPDLTHAAMTCFHSVQFIGL